MKHKVVAILSIVALLTGMLVAVLPVDASPPPPLYDIQDAGPDLRAWEPTRDRIVGPTPMDLPLDETSGGGEGGAGAAATILDIKFWLALDDYCSVYYFKP